MKILSFISTLFLFNTIIPSATSDCLYSDPITEYVEGGAVVRGDYMAYGMDESLVFGTYSNPTSFESYDNDGVGIQVDFDCWTEGRESEHGDFFLPGSEEESYTIGYIKRDVDIETDLSSNCKCFADDDDDDDDLALCNSSVITESECKSLKSCYWGGLPGAKHPQRTNMESV